MFKGNYFNYSSLVLLMLCFSSCENRDVNHDDGPNFSEIHEDIQYHFDQVEIDGHEYFILERDRNNPHEGFGFMAMKANTSIDNQDSIKAYLKTLLDVQIQLLAAQNKTSINQTKDEVNELFEFHLSNSKTIKPQKEKAED
ncbi:MAG: hypothetical protein ABJF04_02625 [Reichenbachiella sp.]|uniref:hypothetical protein n=1 Tax=Reichenbachiella sp. TaxID=2184521 RepID=UPI0032638BFE